MVESLTVSKKKKKVNVKGVRASPLTRFRPKKGKIKEKGRGMLLGSGGSCDILNQESVSSLEAPGEYYRAFFPTAPITVSLETGHG